MKRESPTVYDVAKLANVSPSTVSRFLNRTTFVSDEKSHRIESAIKTLGYKPIIPPPKDTQRRTMTIGALVQHPDSPYTSQILIDLEKVLINHGYSLVIASGHWNRMLGTHALAYLEQHHVDGIIIVTGNLTNPQILDVGSRIPVVAIGYDVEGPNIHSINLDNVIGGYIATLHLLQLGHRNIAHIKGLSSQPDAVDRFKGYTNALQQQNIKLNPLLIRQGDFSLKSAYKRTQELINDNVRFSAIFAANDLSAYGAIKALHDNGLRVPEDISVVGFDDLPTSEFFIPSLTTLRQPIEELGTTSANSILSLLGSNTGEVRIPPIDLIVRDSTKPFTIN
jgi:LacI family transcriptional regulator